MSLNYFQNLVQPVGQLSRDKAETYKSTSITPWTATLPVFKGWDSIVFGSLKDTCDPPLHQVIITATHHTLNWGLILHLSFCQCGYDLYNLKTSIPNPSPLVSPQRQRKFSSNAPLALSAAANETPILIKPQHGLHAWESWEKKKTVANREVAMNNKAWYRGAWVGVTLSLKYVSHSLWPKYLSMSLQLSIQGRRNKSKPEYIKI